MVLRVLDASGLPQNLSTTNDASGNLVGSTGVTDPSSGAKAAVQPFHNADGQSFGLANGIYTGGIEVLYNGATFDRQRGNMDVGAIVTLTAATSSGNSADQTNFNGRGVQLFYNTTAITGSPTLLLTLQGKDIASGQYYTIAAQATAMTLTSTTTALITVYPGASATATTPNLIVPSVLPRTWRVLYTIAGGSVSVTATIGASVII